MHCTIKELSNNLLNHQPGCRHWIIYQGFTVIINKYAEDYLIETRYTYLNFVAKCLTKAHCSVPVSALYTLQ